MSRKRIFYYLLYGNGGGSDQSLYNLIRYLNKDKYTPYVYLKYKSHYKTLLEESGAIVIEGNEIEKNGTPAENENLDKLKKKTTFIRQTKFFYYFYSTPKLLLNSIPEAYKLFKILRKHKIDIVHLNNSLSSNRKALIAGILAGTELISHYRGLSKPEKIDVFLSRYVKKIICISNYVKQEYLSYGISENKCFIIYNGVDTDVFKPANNSGGNKIVIANLGRLERWKGQDLFLEAAAEIRKSYKNLKFLIVGRGSYEQELKDLVKRLNIEEDVEFKGFVQNIPLLLREIDILVHSSTEPEPFGRVIIEGMAAGLPVVATNIGGPLEIIDNGKNGLLFNSNNPAELVNKLSVLLKDRKLFDELKKAAREKVLKKFEIKNLTKEIEELYERN